jgi:anaerobic selenocysteine-containing dehydrogenase
MPLDIAYTACPHDCPSACALDVERLGGNRIGAVRGAEGNRYTAGVVCAKVARYAERVHHPDRLTRPLRRVGAKGDGRFEPLAWDDALDEVADRFLRAAQRHGPEAVWPYYYAGTMGLVQRDGINRLRHVMGYSGQIKTICNSLVDAGWRAGIGAKYGPDTLEIAEADLIVIWGSNPVHTQVNLMHHVAGARKSRGATLVVVDPYRTGTAAVADRHIPIRPGTDGALACAMMHVMFREGLADRAYLARYADVPAELEAHLRTRTPEWAAAITGVPVEEIEWFARLYGATKRAMIRVGYGFSRSRNGAAQVHAVTCLPTVSGAWQHRGGGAIYSHSDIYRLDMRMIDANDRASPEVRQLDMCRIGPILLGDPRDLRGGPPVTAMLIQNTNPMAVAPDTGAVARGMAREDLFVCVHEQFLTETARMADIVLPATTFLEHDDLYYSLGHSHLHAGPKVIEPLGEARCNHEVHCGLAKRLGADHPAFDMSVWEIIDWTLIHSGYPDATKLRASRWHDCQPDFETSHFLNGFPTPDRRFHFAPDWAAAGPDGARMPRLPDHFDVIDKAGEEHPFRLVTAPSRQFLNTSFSETPTSQARQGRPTAKIHPEDCAAVGIADGDLVRLGNRQGSVVVHAEVFDGLQRGVVIVEGIWPNRAFIEGKGINHLVSAEAGFPAGGGVFHDTAVWLRPP